MNVTYPRTQTSTILISYCKTNGIIALKKMWMLILFIYKMFEEVNNL
jgi:hypothetical protein